MYKLIIILFINLFIFSASAEITNKSIIDSKINGKVTISIAVTPLTEKKQIEDLKVNVESNRDYLNFMRPKLIGKNRNRPPRTKFKGPSEEIYKEYAQSVVFIGNYKRNGAGSGFIINHKGKKIITNWHVIQGSKKVRVWLKPENLVNERYMLDNLDSYEARVLKIDKEKDLALLEIIGLPNDIKPVQFGNYKDVNVGETAFAIGHPGELIWSFNSGMVSQLRQDYNWK